MRCRCWHNFQTDRCEPTRISRRDVRNVEILYLFDIYIIYQVHTIRSTNPQCIYIVRLHNNSPLDSQRSPHSWDNMSCLRSAGMIHSADSYVRAPCIHRAYSRLYNPPRSHVQVSIQYVSHRARLLALRVRAPSPECRIVEREEEGRDREGEKGNMAHRGLRWD